MQYYQESSFLDFAVEHILWHEVGVNESLIKIALVQCHLDLLSRSDIVLVDFDPNISWRVLLNSDFLNSFAQVGLSRQRIKHELIDPRNLPQ